MSKNAVTEMAVQKEWIVDIQAFDRVHSGMRVTAPTAAQARQIALERINFRIVVEKRAS